MTGALLPLFVVLPLAAAAAAAIVPWTWVQRVLHLGVPAVTTAGGVALLWHHTSEPVVAHHVGGFVPGIAIPFVSDTFSALMLTVTGITTVACSVFAVLCGEARLRFFPALALMLTSGVNGALLTGDLFNLFVFIEVMLLPSYALIAMTGTWRRLGIGRVFVVVNLMTSTVLLMGVALTYGVAGSVNLGVLAGSGTDDGRLTLALGVVLLALAIKAGAVPVHGWLPRSYPATSAGVMALFSALHTKVALYAMYRVHSIVLEGAPGWAPLVLAVLAITVVTGSYGSLGERVIRRSLAWQMVAGIGYILVGLGVATRLGLAAGIFYMVHHILVMGSLLLASGAIERTYLTGQFRGLSGLMRRDRGLAVIVALGLMSLVGLPPSSGFFGKVGAVWALTDLEPTWMWVLLGVVVLASIGALLSMIHLWSEVFWGPPLEEMPSRGSKPHGPHDPPVVPEDRRIPTRLLVPSGALLAVSLVAFVGAGPVWEICLRAAEALLDAEGYATEVMG